jgi:hypothetical protein
MYRSMFFCLWCQLGVSGHFTPPGKSPWYQLDRSLDFTGNHTSTPRSPPHSQSLPNVLSQFPCINMSSIQLLFIYLQMKGQMPVSIPPSKPHRNCSEISCPFFLKTAYNAMRHYSCHFYLFSLLMLFCGITLLYWTYYFSNFCILKKTHNSHMKYSLYKCVKN